jgi:hypothetical protein
MPRKKSTTKQKQKQSQKQNVKQTVIVKVGESARRRRRRAPSKKTEEGTSTAYPYMGMTLPPPVIYQTGPAFDAPRLQAFQDFEYPRFSKAGEAAIRRAGPAAPILEDIGSIGGAEIIDVKNKKEQLAELGELVPPPAKAAAKAGEAAMKRAEGAKAGEAAMKRAEGAKARMSFNEPFGIPPEAVITDPIPGPAFATPYLPGEFDPIRFKAPKDYYDNSTDTEAESRFAKVGPASETRQYPPNAKILKEFTEISGFNNIPRDEVLRKYYILRDGWVRSNPQNKLNNRTNSKFIKMTKEVLGK